MDTVTITVFAAALKVLKLLDHLHKLLAEVCGEVFARASVCVAARHRLVFVCQTLQSVSHIVARRVRLLDETFSPVARR